ncbi:heme-binding protein [Sphingomonas gilva]|uniref:Heme-binding protein n=1 Tax=Sphingomonas gilva TaxID=2305907 RepID=A0A396RUB3_9SPHN|nr:heme-binding protein [Sphingomonas gilva]RHW19042.1 heme-binding protein [Sphingomonas gilva]
MKADAKTIGTAAAGVAGVAALAAGGWYLFEKLSEKPRHRTLEREGVFELRAYPALLVAETVVEGERRAALEAGFERLADYIFAKSRGGEKISMTAPVLSDREGAGERVAMTAPVLSEEAEGGWRTRFVMPAKYDRASLPVAPASIVITEIPAREMAAVRFSGGSEDANLERQERRLRDWMAASGFEAAGAPEYAFYNSPYIPPFLRRNEVLIPVR